MHFILYSKTLSGAYQLLPQIYAVNIRCQALVTPTKQESRRRLNNAVYRRKATSMQMLFHHVNQYDGTYKLEIPFYCNQ